MKKQEINLTTAQFAAIHEVNPRTLHYYDSVGLFSPERKGENQYRYYTSRQSIDFEYIRMLKELNMSIRELRSYVQEPGPDKFMELADEKINEINREIQRPVSYTHLDVYKRQCHNTALCALQCKRKRIPVRGCSAEGNQYGD